jgi:hypothetical protein
MTLDKDDGLKFEEMDFKFEEMDWSDTNKLLKELSNQPPIELDFPHADLAILLEEANRPFLDISFDDEAIREMLENMASVYSELDFDFAETDLSALIQGVEVSGLEPEPIPEPDPTLTAKDLAAWMLTRRESFIKERQLGTSEDILASILFISTRIIILQFRRRF